MPILFQRGTFHKWGIPVVCVLVRNDFPLDGLFPLVRFQPASTLDAAGRELHSRPVRPLLHLQHHSVRSASNALKRFCLLRFNTCDWISCAVVPGRVVRLLAVVNMESLKLKQAFVRYVAHEIRWLHSLGYPSWAWLAVMVSRSPLNVVHAGLDILRSEVRNLPAAAIQAAVRFMSDLLEDIFSSSETAILILNDLLQYENLDAGTESIFFFWNNIYIILLNSKKIFAAFSQLFYHY